MRKCFFALLVLCVFNAISAQAQPDQRTLNTKIADLLARIPAQNAEQTDKSMQVIADMGQQGLEEMSAMLAAPGKGDNTALQYAIAGFSYYAARPKNEALRNWSVNAYVNALNKISDKENKAFIIRQLEIVGNDHAVASLIPYLSDERLCDPAARALVRINSPSAKKALLDAAKNASGTNRLSLVEALGDTRYAEAAPVIARWVNSDDKKLTKLSLFALARIGDPASEALLARAAEKSGFVYDETGATEAYLQYARTLAASGKKAQASKIAGLIQQKTQGVHQIQNHTAALKILVDLKGEQAVPLLVDAMNDKNPQYRAAALKFAEEFTGNEATALWVKKLDKSSDQVKAEILTMLGRAGNHTALPAELNALQSRNEEVKLAAIRGAGQLGGQEVLPSLLKVMKTGNPQEIDAVAGAIQVMKGPEVTSQAAAALASMPSGNGQTALIHILSERSADDHLSEVLPFLKSKDTMVSKAAYASLKNLVKQQDQTILFDLLLNSDDPGGIKSVQEAVIATTTHLPEPEKVSAIVSEMKKNPAKQTLFFGILSGIGGKEALNELVSAYDNGNEQTKTEAVISLSSCKDSRAAAPLLQICRKAVHADYFNAALEGYVRLAGQTEVLPEQRLLMLHDAMDIAQTGGQKQLILNELGKSKTYLSLLFAGNYLDDPSVQHEAAYAVMRIALSDNDWTGESVRSLLEKAEPLLNGPDANYERQAIQKHLAELPSGEGFVSIFNGKDLSGWKGLVANPIERAKMDAKTLASEQQKADARMLTGWSASNGDLLFSGKGDNLCTKKKYGDFEMFVDWKIEKEGDAGIYLRGSPQVQIWDTSRVDVGAQVGSGGLYNNQVNESKPLKLADNAIGEWNNFHIIMIGDRVTVYLNGVLVVNNIILENYWDRKQPIFPEEQIELQAHGTHVAYRNLYVREIPRPKPFVLSDEEKKEGFKVLFDGTNMYQWTGNTREYVLEDGNIVMRPANGEHGNLFTKDEYSNFIYRFEFQLTPGANNGIGIRAPLEGDAAYVGMEIQVLDNEAPIYKDLHTYQYHGSVYGVIPAKRGFLKPTGEWNYEEISAIGNKIKVTLNGTVILDGDITDAIKNGTLDKKDHPGLKRTTGHIGFLGHGDVVKFRNVRVKPLSD
ncbi:MAG: DUF1080 domain-containing protein [Bacteroidota bacterium]|nr:DUF1080 domain-containing protein [Bacteroidota bacterium]